MERFPILCDLDGVIWLAHQPIAGSVEAVASLRNNGHRVLFVTNNSAATVAEQERTLARIGIEARGDVLTSAQAGGRLVAPAERVLVCGGPGIVEAVTARGAEIVAHADSDTAAIDAVIVGFHRTFDYDVMRRASTAIRRGARLIGTNEDATYPTPEGPIPGGGSILAAIATASGVTPLVAGKPHRAMADLVSEVLGAIPGDAIMVGDRPSTDGEFAATMGCRYALVRSGVTPPGDTSIPVRVDFDVADLRALARSLVEP